MKLKYLSIAIIFVILTAFNISNTYELAKTTINITVEEANINKAGDMVIFSVSLYSSDNLQSLSITPSNIGLNEDSMLKYTFNNSTKYATINYFYVVPANYKDLSEISFNFKLESGNKMIEKTKRIKIGCKN